MFYNSRVYTLLAINKTTLIMKKALIGSLVGGLLIFIWQTLSWTVMDLHRPAQDYTPKQDTIMAFLNATLEKEGGYYIPNTPVGTSMEESTKQAEKMQGKPWATIQYHKSLQMDSSTMFMNMGRGFVVNVIIAWMVCWMISKMKTPSFITVLLVNIFIGCIVFLNVPYTGFIWYKTFDLTAHLTDALVSWALCGAWLGWWLRR